MRINSESDVARLREQLADHMSTNKIEIDNLRRALDDMRYKNEEAVRQISLKNEEVESLMDNMAGFGAMQLEEQSRLIELSAQYTKIGVATADFTSILNI